MDGNGRKRSVRKCLAALSVLRRDSASLLATAIHPTTCRRQRLPFGSSNAIGHHLKLPVPHLHYPSLLIGNRRRESVGCSSLVTRLDPFIFIRYLELDSTVYIGITIKWPQLVAHRPELKLSILSVHTRTLSHHAAIQGLTGLERWKV